MIVGGSLYACGPSSESTNQSATPVSISSSPTGDTAITDGGTGAAKGAEAPDTTRTQSDPIPTTDSTSKSDTTTNR